MRQLKRLFIWGVLFLSIGCIEVSAKELLNSQKTKWIQINQKFYEMEQMKEIWKEK